MSRATRRAARLEAEARAFRRGKRSSGAAAEAAAAQARQPRRQSLAARSAAWKRGEG